MSWDFSVATFDSLAFKVSGLNPLDVLSLLTKLRTSCWNSEKFPACAWLLFSVFGFSTGFCVSGFSTGFSAGFSTSGFSTGFSTGAEGTCTCVSSFGLVTGFSISILVSLSGFWVPVEGLLQPGLIIDIIGLLHPIEGLVHEPFPTDGLQLVDGLVHPVDGLLHPVDGLQLVDGLFELQLLSLLDATLLPFTYIIYYLLFLLHCCWFLLHAPIDGTANNVTAAPNDNNLLIFIKSPRYYFYFVLNSKHFM